MHSDPRSTANHAASYSANHAASCSAANYSATNHATASDDAAGQPIIVAVHDESLAEEVATVIAATGRTFIRVTSVDASDSAFRRCHVAILDNPAATQLARDDTDGGSHCRIFVVHADTEMHAGMHAETSSDELDWHAAADIGAEAVMALPSCGIDLVEALGRDDMTAAPLAEKPAPPAPQVSQPGSTSPARTALTHAAPAHAAPARTSSARGSAIAVVPAVGGAGASVLAAAVAMGVAADAPTVLVDTDPYSGGADLLLGLERESGVRWSDIRAADGRLDFDALYAALPAMPGGPAVLTSARERGATTASVSTSSIRAVIDSVVRAGAIAVVDMGGPGWEWGSVMKQIDTAIVVVPLTVRAVAAASQMMGELAGAGHIVAAVREPSVSGVSVADVEYATGLKVIAQVPHVRGLAKEVDTGGLRGCARRVLRNAGAITDVALGPSAGASSGFDSGEVSHGGRNGRIGVWA